MINIILACTIAAAGQQYVAQAHHTAVKYHISPRLFHAIILVESHYNPNAINGKAPVKSYGLSQLTWATSLEKCGLTRIMDPDLNLECGAIVLKHQLKRYSGNIHKAISAYNAGTYTKKNFLYVEKVLRHMNQCKL